MSRSQICVAITSMFVFVIGSTDACLAQQLYQGATNSELRWSGNSGVDLNGRATNVDGRTVDRYGQSVDDYAWPPRNLRYPRSTASSSGFYSPANGNSTVYSSGANVNSHPGSTAARQYGLTPPRTVVVGGVYPSRTVMNNATRGTVIEYTHNGNGYISNPGSTYQTVISSGPSIFPSISVVPPTQPPVVIETQPTQTVSKTFPGNRPGQSSAVSALGSSDILLVYPKGPTEPLTFLLNGTIYSIKPGYTHRFPSDRPWTIEFLRHGNGSPALRYDLRAGVYTFVADANGWDLMPVIPANTVTTQPMPPSPVPFSPPPGNAPPLLTEPVPVQAPTPSPPPEP